MKNNSKSWDNTRFILAILLAVMMFQVSGCSRIDAGHAGIKVNLYGSDKGVDDVTEVTGRVWYNPFTTSVYEWPLFVQNSIYTKDEREGSKDNQELTVTTKDGMAVSFDIGINWKVNEKKVVQVFKKYRKDLDELSETIMWNYTRKGFNTVAGKYNADSLYGQRIKFQGESEKMIKSFLSPEGFDIEQIILLGKLRLPNSVVANINAKINASQMALRKEKELQQVEADAAKARTAAAGRADSLLTIATAEAKANLLLAKSITNPLVKYKEINKWDGVMPLYMGEGVGFLIQQK